jgi:hypothetical protein
MTWDDTNGTARPKPSPTSRYPIAANQNPVSALRSVKPTMPTAAIRLPTPMSNRPS